MKVFPLRALFVIALLLPGRIEGQEDFRAVDLDRPLRIEDAMAIKYREWEIEAGARADLAERSDAVEGIVELKTGLLPDIQAGIEIEGGWTEEGEPSSGVGGAGAHLLYGLRRETWSAPAVALRGDVNTPGTDDFGRKRWAFGVTAIATRSWERLRMHGNLGYVAAAERDGGNLWRAGVAWDYPLGLFSRTILADVYAEIPTGSGDARVWTELGSRWQMTNRSVLDFGVGTRIDRWADGEANVQLVVGVSRMFGIGALVPVPPYPDPRID